MDKRKLGITIINNSLAVDNKNKEINVFDVDNVHLNPLGYEVMVEQINKSLVGK